MATKSPIVLFGIGICVVGVLDR